MIVALNNKSNLGKEEFLKYLAARNSLIKTLIKTARYNIVPKRPVVAKSSIKSLFKRGFFLFFFCFWAWLKPRFLICFFSKFEP